MTEIKKQIFKGQSMMGTFLNGDTLTLAPEDINDIRSGDVVVFYSRSTLPRKKIAHRVVRNDSSGLVTRGDSSTSNDIGIVNQDLLIGRVCYRERNSKVSVVHGGRIGQAKGRLLNFYWCSRRLIANSIKKPYAVLKNSAIVPLIWKPDIIQILVTTEDGPLIQFIHNKRIIARTWPDQNKYECRKPWDLVIHSKLLKN